MTSPPGVCPQLARAARKQLVDERKTLDLLAAGYSLW
jgi:hypothetical protein